MTRLVIDTNVLKVANGKSEQADPACEEAAGNALQDALRQGVVVLDTEQLAIDEYRKHCSWAGQPGAGDFFFKALTDNIANPSRVHLVDIGAAEDEIDLFVPEALRDFDSDDKKWIALFLEGSADAILNATDSDWAARKADLDSEKVTVRELCANCLNVRRSKPAG
ncbi:hypothetical protein MJO55_17210 [Mycolicibacterium rufum]|uniref:Uncharacterized protein n=1 Tax=Mycolicibacterium rufum TaxID=318424 RepID=A0A9X3BJC5_9MYCO|nr:hypothetical protein [Mycolicibacterium rufum]MCV7073298.1 hypothetical protein [Mycolicibacterium rufum]ULP35044.1 hypothetical protein MJO55_17210 [Mycolicibacterium rufum]